MSRHIDRRQHRRFALTLKLRLTILKNRQPIARGTGRVRNLSKTGIFFETDTFVQRGSALHLVVDWPALTQGQARVQWHVDAICVRSSAHTAAVKIMRQRLVRESLEEQALTG